MQTDLTEIVIILDRSGSMEAIRQDTIGGFNAFLQDQQATPGRAALTLVQFDDQYEVVCEGKPLQDVPPLTTRTYVPRGSTALLDAIGRTVTATGARLAALPEADRAGKVLVVIMTDGAENASREYSRPQVFGMISHQQDVYQWQFVFIGANQDAIQTGAGLGIAAGNTLSFAASPAGAQSMNSKLSKATSKYRAAPASQVFNYFADDPETASEDDSEAED